MIVNELARNVVQTTFGTFDKVTIEQAKNRLIDVVGCIIGGANAGGCNELKNLVIGWGGNEQSTILVHGGKTTAHNAALINTVMGRSFDYGVLIPYIGERIVPAHIAETMVPTTISVAEWKHAGGKELITAMILGDDITTRISAASSFGVMWDTPGTVNKFGATAIAGKLIGLNEKQLVHAFGIVLNQLAGSFQSINDGAHSFKWAQGLASRDGIIAAELAATGWTGCTDPLEGEYAYFSLYCNKYDPEIITKDLGKAFYGDCTFKPYPSCA